MAVKDKVKGICDTSKCNYDVYTSEKVDELLDELEDEVDEINDRFATIEVEGTLVNGVSQAQVYVENIDIPNGFTPENCVVLSINTNLYYFNYSDFNRGIAGGSSGREYSQWFTISNNNNNLYGEFGFEYFKSSGGSTDYSNYVGRTLKARIVLMKIS